VEATKNELNKSHPEKEEGGGKLPRGTRVSKESDLGQTSMCH